MSLRVTVAAVVIAVVLWAVVLLTGEQRGGDAGEPVLRLVVSPAEVVEVRVSREADVSLVRDGAGWEIRVGAGAPGPRAWPADEQGVRELLRMLATAELGRIDGEAGAGEGGSRIVTLVERRGGSDRSIELALSDRGVGAAVAGVVDGRPVRVDSGLAEALTPEALLGLRDLAVFARGGSWVALEIMSDDAGLAVERTRGSWRLPEGQDEAGVRLDQAAVARLVGALQTLRFERHVEPTETFAGVGSVRVLYRDASGDGGVRTETQTVTIGPQADLAGNMVLLRAERASGAIHGEIRTELLPLLPTEVDPLLDRRALSVEPGQVGSVSILDGDADGAAAVAVSRGVSGWQGPRGALRRAASESLTGLVSTLTSDAASAVLLSPGEMTAADTSLRVRVDAGEPIELALTAEGDRVHVADRYVRWRYEGEAARRLSAGVAVIREATAEIGG